MTNLILKHSLQAILQASCMEEEGDEEQGVIEKNKKHAVQPLSVCVIPLLVGDAERLLSGRRRR